MTRGGDPKGKKRSRGGYDNNGEKRVWNSKQMEEFKMRENEDWKKFCGNTVQDRFDWNDDGCKMCPRWHPKGFFSKTVTTKQDMSQKKIFHREK